jgi:AGZA family xanthine/uracil permease-like MFS transporter
LIPDSIQAAISIGIGLITALAGATEINLVVRGKFTILDMGELSPEVVVAIAALVVVAVCLHYHLKGAFCIGLFLGTFVWWIYSGDWPEGLFDKPVTLNDMGDLGNDRVTLLIFNLFFLYVLTLNGLARSLSDLGNLTKKSGAIPRGNFLFIVCGLTTMLSGYFSGPPILISPESGAGIKAGAKTGLSTLVCGLLFGCATFFAPVFAAVPPAGTAPLLIMIGVMMFANCKRIDWTDYKLAVPAYCVLFFIPFTYSILRGVAFGYAIYVLISFYTGDYVQNFRDLYGYYSAACCGPWTRQVTGMKPLATQEETMEEEETKSVRSDDYAEQKKKGGFIGNTIVNISKMLDENFEMEDTGGIGKFEQF